MSQPLSLASLSAEVAVPVSAFPELSHDLHDWQFAIKWRSQSWKSSSASASSPSVGAGALGLDVEVRLVEEDVVGWESEPSSLALKALNIFRVSASALLVLLKPVIPFDVEPEPAFALPGGGRLRPRIAV